MPSSADVIMSRHIIQIFLAVLLSIFFGGRDGTGAIFACSCDLTAFIEIAWLAQVTVVKMRTDGFTCSKGGLVLEHN